MKKFTIYWLDGKKQILEGKNIADAFNQAGYGNGALRAVDFYYEGECNDYAWNKESHKWEWTEEKKKALLG